MLVHKLTLDGYIDKERTRPVGSTYTWPNGVTLHEAFALKVDFTDKYFGVTVKIESLRD